MSLLQKTKDRIEQFSLEVARERCEELRLMMADLSADLNGRLDGKLDMKQYYILEGRVSDLNQRLDSLVRKFDHDRDCMTNALASISQILLGMFAQGVNVTEAEKDHLLALQAEVNELQTHNKYWYGELTNRAGYY